MSAPVKSEYDELSAPKSLANTVKLPFNLKELLLWTVIVYSIYGPVQDVINALLNGERFVLWGELHDVLLDGTGYLAFSAFSLSMYTVLYYAYERFSWWLLIPVLVLCGLLSIAFRAFLQECLLDWLTGRGNYRDGISWQSYVQDNLNYAITFSGLGIIFFFFQSATLNAKAHQTAKIAQREAELKFLRSQVNPHFLFNTLNNLYALVNDRSEQALPVLEKLSGILRYALYEQKQQVPIATEMSYLRDLVHLESLRVQSITPIVFEEGKLTKAWLISPLLLVPFVENAFKHGLVTSKANPLTLKLHETAEGELVFAVRNQIKTNQLSKDAVGGIGLQNVRKRLELLYPGRHQLNISKGEDVFLVSLRLW